LIESRIEARYENRSDSIVAKTTKKAGHHHQQGKRRVYYRGQSCLRFGAVCPAGKTVKPFAAFSAYLELGEERSYARVGQKLGKSRVLIERWGSEWKWQERVLAWDNDLARQANKRAVKELEEMYKRQAKIAMLMQKKAVEALENIDPEKLDEGTIVRFITEGTKLERSNRLEEVGISPLPAPVKQKRPAVTGSDINFSELTTEELRRLAGQPPDQDRRGEKDDDA
jgi:hypothetical protein